MSTRVGRDRSKWRKDLGILVGIDIHLFCSSRFRRREVALPYYDLCRSESISLQTLTRYDRNVVAYLLRYVRYGGAYGFVSYNRLKPVAHRPRKPPEISKIKTSRVGQPRPLLNNIHNISSRSSASRAVVSQSRNGSRHDAETGIGKPAPPPPEQL